MSFKIGEIEMEVLIDPMPDCSYLEQEGYEKRLEELHFDVFYFVGIRAKTTIEIPQGNGHISQLITSPGLWGIESDSGDDYFQEVFKDEKVILLDMLEEMRK